MVEERGGEGFVGGGSGGGMAAGVWAVGTGVHELNWR